MTSSLQRLTTNNYWPSVVTDRLPYIFTFEVFFSTLPVSRLTCEWYIFMKAFLFISLWFGMSSSWRTEWKSKSVPIVGKVEKTVGVGRAGCVTDCIVGVSHENY